MPTDRDTDKEHKSVIKIPVPGELKTSHALGQSKTGCTKCDKEGLPYCKHANDKDNGNDSDKENDDTKSFQFTPDTQTPTDKNSTVYKALVPLENIKKFFDDRLTVLAAENLAKDVNEYKKEIGYSAEINGNTLTVKISAKYGHIMDNLIQQAQKNGMISPTPENNLAAKDAPTPFNTQPTPGKKQQEEGAAKPTSFDPFKKTLTPFDV